MVETYNQLLVEMIDRSEEEIFVTSADGRRILYCKKRNDRSIDRNEVYQMCIRFAQKQRSEESRDSFEWIWEAEDSRHHFIGSLPDICSGRENRPFFILSGM